MRTSALFLPTLKETPSDAEVISHQLMLRAGMIRKLASGLYSWLPLGLKVVQKIERIVREEMNRAGAQELLMPAVQPAELWQESGRWQAYGPELLRLTDRHHREFCFGPTHEEVITDIVRKDLRSYKQLPLVLYQIQTKFRDEIRPRFGVMRSREFIMKDAYSFHLDSTSLEETYQTMYDAYTRIFNRIGLDYRAVIADSGSIGGDTSHEFHVLADSGEDAIAFSTESEYAANVELAQCLTPDATELTPTKSLTLIETPNKKSVDEVASFLNVAHSNIIKTLIVKTADGGLAALVLRGDHELNPIKAEKHPLVASPLEFATDEEIKAQIGVPTGFVGPVNLNLPTIADPFALNLSDFICGANQADAHFDGVNWDKDCQRPESFDLKMVTEGDTSPDGKGTLTIKRGIEVGHIFQLGKKYSDALTATVLNESGKSTTVSMGCYGIGVTRIAAAAIEQGHDDKGIIWPNAIAPFEVVIIPMNAHKSPRVTEVSEKLYQDLKSRGIDVLLEDRQERPGVLFANADLIGIPHRVIVGERNLDENMVEYKARKSADIQKISLDTVVNFVSEVTSSS